MLIIEIALGIVLAVIILRYWQEIIRFGGYGILFITIVSGILFGGYYLYENLEKVAPFLAIAFVLFIFFSAFVVINFFGQKLSVISLEKWNLSCSEITGIIFIISMVFLGMYFILSDFISGENNDATFGFVFFFLGVIGGFVHLRDIKKAREQRAIRKTYAE